MTPTRCPSCDHELDASTSMTEREVDPLPGDLTVCLYCGAALTFTTDGLRLLEPQEIATLKPAEREQLDRVRQAVLDRIAMEVRT
jgi:hypothetical protein